MNKQQKKQKKKQARKGYSQAVVAVNQKVVTRPASFLRKKARFGGDGRIVITHREYIGDVYADGTVNPFFQSYAINPGDDRTFPWLSKIAYCYESYTFNRLKFEYVPSCATSTAGYVGLTVDYDAADPAPTNKQAFMSYHSAVRGSIWDKCALSCDGQDLRKFAAQRYNRYAPLLANQDVKTYDAGNMYVMAQSSIGGSASNPGELYVEYEVVFHTPQLSEFESSADSAKITTTTCTKASPLLNSVVTYSAEGLKKLVLDSPSMTSAFRILKAGEYMLENYAFGTGFTDTGMTLTSAMPGFISAGLDYVTNSAQTVNMTALKFTAPEPGDITLNVPAAWTTLTQNRMRLSPYCNNLT